ncbi:MAG TPA: hypothetical protein VLA16_21220 [Ideonella sp.]|nr:hypothetical protein [Ideonella sp.]
MKTIVTLLIALLGFATSVAWAGPEQGQAGAVAQQVQSAPAGRQAAAPAASAAKRAPAARGNHKPAGNPAAAASYEFDLPAVPAVLCACVVDKNLG